MEVVDAQEVSEFETLSVGRFSEATGIEPATLRLTPRALWLLTGRSIWGVAKNNTSPVNSRALFKVHRFPRLSAVAPGCKNKALPERAR